MTAEGTLLLLSDSHGDSATMIKIIHHRDQEIDAVLFTGDGANELLESAYIFDHLPFYAVIGNNDHLGAPSAKVQFPLEQTIELFGWKIYLTHGHIVNYRDVKKEVLQRAKRAGASIALYGHLHLPEAYREDHIYRLNAGSMAYPRGGSEPSYVILRLFKDHCIADFFHAKSHEKIARFFDQ